MASASTITHSNRCFTSQKGHAMTDEMLRAAKTPEVFADFVELALA
jgi:hypothetical protein